MAKLIASSSYTITDVVDGNGLLKTWNFYKLSNSTTAPQIVPIGESTNLGHLGPNNVWSPFVVLNVGESGFNVIDFDKIAKSDIIPDKPFTWYLEASFDGVSNFNGSTSFNIKFENWYVNSAGSNVFNPLGTRDHSASNFSATNDTAVNNYFNQSITWTVSRAVYDAIPEGGFLNLRIRIDRFTKLSYHAKNSYVTYGTVPSDPAKRGLGNYSTYGWKASPEAATQSLPYLWIYQIQLFDNGSEVAIPPAIIGAKGDPGQDGLPGAPGVGIKSTVSTYGLSSNETTQPATWSATVPALIKGQYLWTKNVWTYTDGRTETGYTKTYIPRDGNNGTDGIAGKDGVGITSTTITYASSSSGTTAPTSGWTANVPNVSQGQYLWTKTIWSYTDSTNETGYSVARIGADGTGVANATNFYLASNQSTGIEKPAEVFNLIRNGAYPTNTQYWSGSMIVSQHNFYYEGQKKLFLLQTTGTAEITASSNRFAVKRNTNYTLSFYAFAGSNVRNSDVYFLGRKSNETNDFTFINTLIYGRRFSGSRAEYVTVTFNSGDNDSGYIRFDNNGSTDGINAVLFFGEVMLVEGKEPKPWVASILDSGWTTTPQPISNDKRFLWNYRIELYTDGTTKATEPAVIGVYGDKGDQGIPGPKGADGKTQYTHIAYADNATGGGFSQTDQTKAYIGMYQDFTATDSTNPASYRWTKWKGSDGDQGIPGPKGADGQTPYIHFAYSDNADGTGLTLTDNGQRYMGNYSDYTQADSTDKTKYRWADRWAKIEVGGRNLWIQYKVNGGFVTESLPDNHVTGQRTCYKLTNNTSLYFNIEPDFSSRLYQKVTFSAWIKYDNVVQGTNNWNAFNCFKHSLIRKNSSTGAVTNTDYVTLAGFTGTSDWKYISYTYDYSANKSYDQLKTPIYFNLESVASGTAWVTGIMIQFGNIATGHEESPEDIEKQIDSKADKALTLEQKRELEERMNIIESELKARALLAEMDAWFEEYTKYKEGLATDKAESETKLTTLSGRVDKYVEDLGAMSVRWNFLDTYMKAGNEGLMIGKMNGTTSIRVSDNRIAFYSGGKEVAFISNDTLEIENGIFTTQLQVGRFQTSQYGPNPDSNIVRYVG